MADCLFCKIIERKVPGRIVHEDDALLGKLFRAGARIAKARGVDGSGWRTVMNANHDAGQSVFHIHLHVLGGRRMAWPPG